jgi:enoyl-CoA hydratase/carnithine racemase
MIRIDNSEGIATVTIDRPEVKNALNLETVNALRAALQTVAADDGAGVLIVTGAGDTAFVS